MIYVRTYCIYIRTMTVQELVVQGVPGQSLQTWSQGGTNTGSGKSTLHPKYPTETQIFRLKSLISFRLGDTETAKFT